MPESGTSGSAGGPGPATAQVYPPDAPLVGTSTLHPDPARSRRQCLLGVHQP